jgi:hypothetical protein
MLFGAVKTIQKYLQKEQNPMIVLFSTVAA